MSPSLRMGRYIAEGLLGPGGATETYLARLADEAAPAAGQLFALKLLRQDRVSDHVHAEVAGRFVAAGEQLAGFHRPGFGKVVEVCRAPEGIFIVTEHVAGLDLARSLEIFQAEGRPGMDPVIASLIGAESARLLHVGHAAKPSLFHLGLAPQNVVVTEAGEVMLLDAGLAAALRSLVEQPAERWWFVAPELLNVDAGRSALSERQGVAADLYSLGALLFFLVTGKPPHEHTPMPATVGVPPGLEGIPGQLGAAMRRLLAPQPDDRPESAALLVEWLSSGVDSTRERQRLIGEAMRAAEEEARKAAAARAEANAPLSIKLPPVAGGEKGKPGGVGGTHARAGRWLAGALVMLAVVVAGAGVVFLTMPAMLMSGAAGSGVGPLASGQASAETEAGPGTHATPRLAGEGTSASPTREKILAQLAGHLVAETVPPGATVWVDGVAKGTTFADIVVGTGRHRVALTLPGHRTFREMVDTTRGAIIRRNLFVVPPEARSGGFVRVECGTVGKYPILLDDDETGLLCPSLAVPTTVGKHMVGIYLPIEKRVVSLEVTVAKGGRPAMAKFNE